MEINRGDVFYVNRSETIGSEQRSGRPAIIVSNPECNERCPGKRPKRYHTPMPEDFPEKNRLLRCTDLAEHYGVSDWIIWRWRKELRKKGEK